MSDLSTKYAIDAKTLCWNWIGRKDKDGYGQYGEKNLLAHRVVYKNSKGAIPVGLVSDHLCRNRACVNPDHIEFVQNKVNVQRGLSAKLSPSQVAGLRTEYKSGDKQESIAAKYGITQSAVSRIVNKKNWNNI